MINSHREIRDISHNTDKISNPEISPSGHPYFPVRIDPVVIALVTGSSSTTAAGTTDLHLLVGDPLICLKSCTAICRICSIDKSAVTGRGIPVVHPLNIQTTGFLVAPCCRMLLVMA